MVIMQYISIALEFNIFQKKLKIHRKHRNTIKNIYRIQSYDSIMCECFCIGFIDFMLKGRSFLGYTNLFCPNDYEKNDKIILKYFP